MNKVSIDILGRGNVASHLGKALEGKADVRTIDPHTLLGMRPDASLIIISVSDNAIRHVADHLISKYGDRKIPVAHTSGSTSIEILRDRFLHCGVLYPMQTFSKSVELDYSAIPVFIEASDPKTGQILERTAKKFTGSVHHADSTQRRSLHLGAVLSCNFVNHLWALTEQFLDTHDLPFSAMYPLINETLRKAMANHPADVQTGPAARNDTQTIQAHLELLKDNPRLANIYKTLSQSILSNNERNQL